MCKLEDILLSEHRAVDELLWPQLDSIDWDALAKAACTNSPKHCTNDDDLDIFEVKNSCNCPGTDCVHETSDESTENCSTFSTPSKVCQESILYLENDMSDICDMDMDNMIIVMDYEDNQKKDENSTGETEEVESKNFDISQNRVETITVGCKDLLQTVVMDYEDNQKKDENCTGETEEAESKNFDISENRVETITVGCKDLLQTVVDSVKEDSDVLGYDVPKRICVVCNDIASGCHYGVSSCEACKSFFKRTIQGNIDYTCPNSNDCEVSKRRRKACQACRFQKCLKMGMLQEGVRLDRVRGGRQKYRRMIDSPYKSSRYTTSHTLGYERPILTLDKNKIFNVLLACEPEVILAFPERFSKANNECRDIKILSKLYEQQLKGVMKWAKEIPGFVDLTAKDQTGLIRGSWSEVCTLSTIFRSLPTTVAAANLMAKDVSRRLKFAPDYVLNQEMAKKCGLNSYYEQCLHILNRIDQLGLRKEEYIFLKAIIVSNCDTQLDEVLPLHKLKDDLLASLHDTVAVIRCGNPLVHVQNLLLLLPSIRQADLMMKKFWQNGHQSGQVKLHKNLVEMLDVENCDI